LGAIDPAHVKPELPKPAPFAYRAESCLVALVQQQLVRVLQTACDIGQLEATSYAIQSLLQYYTKRRLQLAVRAMKVGADKEYCCSAGTLRCFCTWMHGMRRWCTLVVL
jgi:hypothetical protein